MSSFGTTLTDVPASEHPPLSDQIWTLVQRTAAGMLLVALLPVFGLIALVVMRDGGPLLFKQERPGRGGQRFVIYKIRTMSVGSEKKTALGVTQSSSSITRFGRILRQTKIDELPQLWNVVKGDMAIVGPRPIPSALHEELARLIPRFDERYDVRPGLTNVSQVSVIDNGVGEDLIDDWTQRFEGERQYLASRSVRYDLVVIAMTVFFILRRLLVRSKRTTTSCDRTMVAGTPVANLDYDGVIARIGSWIEARRSASVAVCSVHSIIEGRWNDSHRAALDHADLCTADGMPVVWMQWLMGNRRASRVYGPTLTQMLLARAASEGWRVAFYGGRDDALARMLDVVRAEHPELQVTFAKAPPFRPLTPMEDAADMAQLNAAKPDLIFVGLGCPKQEQWMADHVGRVPGVMLGVGAAFDFIAGTVRQAPRPLQKLGLEWAFRLAMEPRRLMKRYCTTNPAYLLCMAQQVLGRFILRRSYQSADLQRREMGLNKANRSGPRRASAQHGQRVPQLAQRASLRHAFDSPSLDTNVMKEGA